MQDGTDLTPDKLAELEKGNMLNADYTKKTQDLAEKEKNLAKKPNTKQDAPDMSAMLDEKLDARDAKSKFLTDNKLDAIPTETQEVMDKYP